MTALTTHGEHLLEINDLPGPVWDATVPAALRHKGRGRS
jgi:hypothetical protein